MSETFHSLKASGTEKEKKEKRDGKFRSDGTFLDVFSFKTSAIFHFHFFLGGGGHCALNGVLRGHFLGIKMPQ